MLSSRVAASLLLQARANVSRAALLGLTVAEWRAREDRGWTTLMPDVASRAGDAGATQPSSPRLNRAAGDAPGHEFHGNQWTSGSNASEKVDAMFSGEGVRVSPVHGKYVLQPLAKDDSAYDRWDKTHATRQPFDKSKAQVKEVPVAHIDFSQERIYETQLRAKLGQQDTGAHGNAFEANGRFYLLDGNHRVLAEVLKGNSTVRLNVVQAEKTVGRKWSQSKQRFLSATSSRDATPVHRAADAHYKAMMIAVSYGFMRGKKAYKSGGVDAAVKAIKSALLTSLPPVLIKTFVAGGNAGVGMLPRQSRAAMRALAPFDIRFDVSNPAAVKYAREHASKIADDISQTSKDRINAAIADALDGDGLDAAYDTILDAVGSESRADMIARTESLDAANQGTLASWAEAVDNGLLDKSATKVWLASSDCCDLCDELSDEEVGLDEDFSSGDDAPPAHPSCRCSVSLGTGSAE